MFNYNKFRELRKKFGYLQSDIASILNVSTSTIGMWEQGRNQPDNESLVKMANLFDVSTDYLLDHDGTSKYLQNATEDKELNKKILQMAQDEFDRTLFKKYGDLSDEQKKLVMAVINGIIEEADKED